MYLFLNGIHFSIGVELINFTQNIFFMVLIGPFKQIVTLRNLPLKGALVDEQLEIITNGAVFMEEDEILDVGDFEYLQRIYPNARLEIIEGDHVLFPGFVDSHTHICFAGNRANDFAMRNAGKSYLDIAQSGGGIWSSVQHTRQASQHELESQMLERISFLAQQGITTIEVKSGYGLDVESELKMLRAIKNVSEKTPVTLVSTCLSAHLKPKDFEGSDEEYLNFILHDILPKVKEEGLANRVDIFIEKSAFQPENSREFLLKAKEFGFELTVHADQFTPGSSRIAVEVGALSADHLEATSDEDIDFLAQSPTVATALPGASLGLGEPFAPARKLLNAGACLAIATDWNPGSAPMGNLVTQASVLATFEKLTTAEVLAGITFRAAKALNLTDRGIIDSGKKADLVVFKTDNFQNILYQQGSLKPSAVYVNGQKLEL